VVSCDGGRVAALVPAGEAKVGIQMEPTGGYDSEQSGGEWRGATYRVTRDGTGGAVHVFDRWSGADLLRIPIAKTEAVGFSATGAYLAAFTGHQIRVWRASDGDAVGTRTTEDEVERVGFAAGDTVWYALLKTGDDITSFESGRITPQGLTRAMAMKGIRDATVCEANGRAWLGENDTSVVVDAGAGTRLAALPVGAPQSLDSGAGFSRDCTRIAAADGSDVVVWNASNGRELRRIRVGEPQRQWTFTPDGAALVTIANPAGSTGSARVWDLESGAEVAQLGAQHELDHVSVWHAFFTDDNAPLLHLIIGHTFGTSMMPLSAYWRTADLVELACKQLRRNLTSDEWTAYLGPEPFRETCPRGSGR
jgi:WD40 repeat protein